jgi:hypothetical protein
VRAVRLVLRLVPTLSILAPAMLAGCLQIGTGSGSGGGADGGPTAAGGGADSGPVGAGCVQDPQTQVVLCEQIDVCPTVIVEPGAYPNCGFRLYSASPLDLECLCGDALCPIGVPTSCADAQQLLDARNSLQVCQQSTEGSCLTLVTPDAGSGSGSAGPCAACAAQCGGSPACYAACGC